MAYVLGFCWPAAGTFYWRFAWMPNAAVCGNYSADTRPEWMAVECLGLSWLAWPLWLWLDYLYSAYIRNWRAYLQYIYGDAYVAPPAPLWR